MIRTMRKTSFYVWAFMVPFSLMAQSAELDSYEVSLEKALKTIENPYQREKVEDIVKASPKKNWNQEAIQTLSSILSLKVETNDLIDFLSSYYYKVDHIFNHSLYPTASIELLKEVIKSDQANLEIKLDALIFLEQQGAEGLRDFVMSQVNSLKDEITKSDFEGSLALLYYILEENDLYSSTYRQFVQKMIHKTDDDYELVKEDILKKLRDAGLDIQDFKDLIEYDPSTVLPILMLS